MYPTLQLPGLDVAVPSQQAMLLVAALVGLTLGPFWIRRLERLPIARIMVALVLLCLAALIGGHLQFVLNTWELYFANRPLAALEFWSGQHAAGAVAALAICMPIVGRRLSIPVGKLGDALVPTAGVCIAIARVGCFLRGCCYGTVCNFPWCVTFPTGTYVYLQHRSLGLVPPDAVRSAPVQPLQLFFAGAALGMTALALWWYPRKRFDGEVALAALVVFSGTSAALEFLRGDFPERAYWGALPGLAWAALALAAVAAVALLFAERQFGRSAQRQVLET